VERFEETFYGDEVSAKMNCVWAPGREEDEPDEGHGGISSVFLVVGDGLKSCRAHDGFELIDAAG